MKKYCLYDTKGIEFKGTAKEVVKQLRAKSFWDKNLPLDQYLQKLVYSVWRFHKIGVHLTGETLDEKCESFIEQILGKLLFTREQFIEYMKELEQER